jgi:phospholipase/carboxylesterase
VGEATRRRGLVAGLHCTWRLPADAQAPLVVLLHGLSGDEDVMWGLEPVIPRRAYAVSPRAPFAFTAGGFSWVDPAEGPDTPLPAYAGAVRRLAGMVAAVREQPGERALVLMGFSQGAAVALASVGLGQLTPSAIVVMAGLLPPGELPPWPAVPVFWGHGRRDDLIPIERARRDVARLERAGTPVTFCEADVGHKLGAECLKGVRRWLAGLGLDDQPPEA